MGVRGAVSRVAVTDEERRILVENRRSAPYVLVRARSEAVRLLAERETVLRPHRARR